MSAGEELLLELAHHQTGTARHIARVRQAQVIGVPCVTRDGHLRMLLRKR